MCIRARDSVVVTESGGLSGREKKSKKYEGNARNTVQETPINEDLTGSLVPVRGTRKGDVEYTSVAVVLFAVFFLYSSSTTVAEDPYWPLVGLPPIFVTTIFFSSDRFNSKL